MKKLFAVCALLAAMPSIALADDYAQIRAGVVTAVSINGKSSDFGDKDATYLFFPSGTVRPGQLWDGSRLTDPAPVPIDKSANPLTRKELAEVFGACSTLDCVKTAVQQIQTK